jgi:hypothetical protein
MPQDARQCWCFPAIACSCINEKAKEYRATVHQFLCLLHENAIDVALLVGGFEVRANH